MITTATDFSQALVELRNSYSAIPVEVKLKQERLLRDRELAELEALKVKAEVPERYLNSCFANYEVQGGDDSEVDKVKCFAGSVNAKIKTGAKSVETLVILGGNGSGKTHLAISVLEHVRYNGLYITSPTLCMRLIRSRAYRALKDEETLLREVASARVLVIDEVGRARDAETEEHAIYDILNLRYEKNLDTVLISNKNRKEFQDYLGKASMDRISENYSFAELSAGSFRRMKNKSAFDF